MPNDNDILADLSRFASHALDVDGRTFDQFVLKAQSRGVHLADMVHAVNDVHARYVLKGKTFEPISALLYSCQAGNRDPLPPRALTFKQWRDAEAGNAKTQADQDAEKRRRDDDLERAREFVKRGEAECKRICAEFMQIAAEFRRQRNVSIGAQLAMELSQRQFADIAQRIESGLGTALVQDAAYVECWARGTWQFPKLAPETGEAAGKASPQMIEHERMERMLEERDGPLADAFCRRDDRMERVLAALDDPRGPLSHLQAHLGKWAAQGDLNWRAATVTLCSVAGGVSHDEELSLRPSARRMLAILERQARKEQTSELAQASGA